MQALFQRVVRCSAVVAASAAVMTVGADAASATTIRQGTTTTLPAATSPIVPSGTTIGAASLASSATFTAPLVSGTCAGGAASGVVGTNPATPSVALTSPAIQINTCTDNNPNYDIIRFELSNAPTLSATYVQSASPQGTVTIPNATFNAVFRLSSDLIVRCSLLPVSEPVVGQIRNGGPAGGTPGTSPSLTFTDLRLRTPVASSICADQFGNGTPASNSTAINATFAPLRTIPAGGTGNFIGIFP